MDNKMMSEEYIQMLSKILLKRENIMPSDFNKIYLTDFSRRNALRQCHLKKYIKYNPRTGFFDLNNEKAEEIANIVAGASE